MLRSGRVVVLVMVVVLAGCAGFAGDSTEIPILADDSDDESAPVSTPMPTPESTPALTPAPEPTATPTPEPTPEYDPDDVAFGVDHPDAATIATYQHNDSVRVTSGTLEVYDEDGVKVESQEILPTLTQTVDGLEPGHNYTVKISNFQDGLWPNVTKTIDPGQGDHFEIYAPFEFRGADSFEYQWRSIEANYIEDGEIVDEEEIVERQRQILGIGKYDDGSWFHDMNTYRTWVDPDVNVTGGLSFDDKTYSRGFQKGWREINRSAFDPNHGPEFKPAIQGPSNIEDSAWKLVGTQELNDSDVPEVLRFESLPEENNGTEALVYEVNLWGYSEWARTNYDYEDANARVYVDPETGYVLRWVAEERLSIAQGFYDYYHGMNPSIHVIDFYNHDDDDIRVKPWRYPLP